MAVRQRSSAHSHWRCRWLLGVSVVTSGLSCWSRRGDDHHTAFEIAGDSGEMNLDGRLGQSLPSHATKAVASLPGAKDFLDPATYTVDRWVPGIESLSGFGFVTAPDAGSNDAWRAALGAHGITKLRSPIGAVGKNLAGIVRQSLRASLAIIDIGRSDRDLFNQRSIGVGAHMGFEAVNRWSALVLNPMRVAVLLACRGNDGRIDERTGLDRACLGLELAGDFMEQ